MIPIRKYTPHQKGGGWKFSTKDTFRLRAIGARKSYNIKLSNLALNIVDIGDSYKRIHDSKRIFAPPGKGNPNSIVVEIITAEKLPPNFKDDCTYVCEGSNKELDAMLKIIDPIYKKDFETWDNYNRSVGGAEPCFKALQVDNLIYFEVERIAVFEPIDVYFIGFEYFKVTKTTIL